MKLTKPQVRCLKEFDSRKFYPGDRMPKVRWSLEKIGLVEERCMTPQNPHSKYFNPSTKKMYALTELGKKTLAEIAA